MTDGGSNDQLQDKEKLYQVGSTFEYCVLLFERVQALGLSDFVFLNWESAQLVADLSREETREAALLELSKKREAFPDLAPILWHSFGTTATLLQVPNSRYYNLIHLSAGMVECGHLDDEDLLSALF